MTFRRHWWIFCSAALILGYTTLVLSFPKNSPALTTIGDFITLLLMVLAVAAAAANAVRERGQTRVFWALLATGYLLWAVNQGLWTVYEVFLGLEIPDPFVGDVILFVHIVPLMAAVALRVDQVQEEKKLHLGTLNFVMLLIWWMFLYAFIVFPDEYVVLNKALYTRNYDRLYVIENWVLLGVLGVLTVVTRGGWRKVYRNLLIGCGMYSVSSVVINAAIEKQEYYTGSAYDVPLLVSVCWLIWTSLEARASRPAAQPAPAGVQRWQSLPPRLAMAAMLSAPLMGCGALWVDTVPQRLHFRLLVVLIAMVVLASFIFLRQYLLDKELLRLLDESRQSLASMQRAQNQLLQKEKLASLGQLVSGVAHEINNPLAAILGYSELLASGELDGKQAEMARKIGQQARRTRDLVSRMLNFAQQAPAEKTLLDVGALLQRALQVEVLRMGSQNIVVPTNIPPGLPRIWGNANQLLQCFLQIISNAKDALVEVGGGTFSVNARHEGEELVLEFLDTGPGLRDPQRVFDPFYTTKPVGRGTGLGLSATYGVVQDHGGRITCENRPEGGAAFVIRLPVAKREAEGEMAKAQVSVR